jgi:glutaminyl-peptide cyclotransferase
VAIVSIIKFLFRICFLPLWLLTALIASSCSSQSPSISQTVPVYTYKIVNSYAHDRNAFTEGLAFNNGFLYESTGQYGNSSLRKVDLVTGDVLQLNKLPAEYFGEGIAVYDDTIVQLTWQSHTGLVYNKDSFGLLRQFSYPTEGWGITYDGRRLIMSDGTSTLYFLDPKTFESIGSIEVRDGDRPVNMLNELEYVNGKVYANVWKKDRIAIIEQQDGHITGWIDLSGLLQTQSYGGYVDVLNGIAYDEQTDRLFVTGKLWPFLFEIKLVPEE